MYAVGKKLNGLTKELVLFFSYLQLWLVARHYVARFVSSIFMFINVIPIALYHG